MKKMKKLDIFVHTTFVLMIIMVVVPLFGVVMVSLTSAEDVRMLGYQFLPSHYSFDAYKLIFDNILPVIRAIGLTLFTATVATCLNLALCSLMAYGISSPNFAYKRIANTYILIPMVLQAGLVPTYIVNTRLLGLSNNIWIYLLSGLCSTWTIILFRTFFAGIPTALVEAARIDGATELQTFLKVIIPLSKPIFAAQFCTGFLQRWNNFETPLYYITDSRLYNIQGFLQNILQESKFLNQLYKDNPAFAGKMLPEETIPFAMAVVACVPVILMFPFMQKYFSKGIAVGSVKG